MRDPAAYEATARKNLGAAYPIFEALPVVGKSGYRTDPPILTAQKGDSGWQVVVERWFEDAGGWDRQVAPVDGASYATWGEAHAALLELLPRASA
jgi:hypothetical protein